MEEAEELSPVCIKEHIQVKDLMKSSNNWTISIYTQSDKFISSTGKDRIVLADIKNPPRRIHLPFGGHFSCTNPDGERIAVLALNVCTIDVCNINTKDIIKSTKAPFIRFIKWISPTTLGLVTLKHVYHWSVDQSPSPVHMFKLNKTLKKGEILNYVADDTETWLAFVVFCKSTQRNYIQLHSVELGVSRVIDRGTAAVFTKIKLPGNLEPTSLLCYVTGCFVPDNLKDELHITEINCHPNINQPFSEKVVNVYSIGNNVCVGIHSSEKYGILFTVTTHGYVTLYDIESGQCIYMTLICGRHVGELFLLNAAYEEAGVLAMNEIGWIMSLNINENNILPYLILDKENVELAKCLARRCGFLPGAVDLLECGSDEECFVLAESGKLTLTPSSDSLSSSKKHQGRSPLHTQSSSRKELFEKKMNSVINCTELQEPGMQNFMTNLCSIMDSMQDTMPGYLDRSSKENIDPTKNINPNRSDHSSNKKSNYMNLTSSPLTSSPLNENQINSNLPRKKTDFTSDSTLSNPDISVKKKVEANDDVTILCECPICLEIFNDPKSLPCEHTFCKDCIEEVVQFTKKGLPYVKCPLCSYVHQLESKEATIGTLKCPLFLKQVLTTVCGNVQNNTNPIPECCDEQTSWYCGDCDVHTCETCVKQHVLGKCTSYTYVRYCKSKAAMLPYCKHHQSFKYYGCKTCVDAICPYCKQDHELHEVCSLNDYTDVFKGYLKKKINAAKKYEDTVNTMLEDKLYGDIEEAIEQKARVIEGKCSSFVNLIKKKLKQDISEYRESEVEKWKILLVKNKESVENAKELLTKENVDILLRTPKMLQRMPDSLIVPESVVVNEEDVKKHCDDILKAICGAFGSVTLPVVDDSGNIGGKNINVADHSLE